MTTSLFDRLADFGTRSAIHVGGVTSSYVHLAAEADAMAAPMGDGRRLVLISSAHQRGSLLAYVGALRAGHVVLLCAPDNVPGLSAEYSPDVICDVVDGQWRVCPQRPASAHDLHPELALLLSTSGSTGSAKLVRLSYDNLSSNAAAIAEYLRLSTDDCAATTLPMHYCYGLSVLNSHLMTGASLLINDYSVVDPCFWDEFNKYGATSLAGVPYTFEMLERIGFQDKHLPTLRYLTQAGGRLAPETVRRFAGLGKAKGWELFVMYGQTEATARMAYVPPDQVAEHPDCIGVPIPGGRFTIQPIDGLESDGGELVYEGPGVMLGYATSKRDLSLGRTISALRTGDIARRTDDGLYQVIGRRSRFVKLFGLRIDLDQVQSVLADEGLTTICTGNDDMVVVATEGRCTTVCAAEVVTRRFSLPASSVRVVAFDELPRLSSGKPDYVSVERAGREGHACRLMNAELAKQPPLIGIRGQFAQVLNRREVTAGDSFVSLGGDSMSYVEMSAALEEELGHLPANWHTMTIKELEQTPKRRNRWARLDMTVVMRALAIVVVVGTHLTVFGVQGGAHLLLAVAGWNYARFALDDSGDQRRSWGRIARVAAPAFAWAGLQAAATTEYTWANAMLINNYADTGEWSYWFIETLVHILAVLAVVMAIPMVRRLERRFRLAFPLAMVAGGLLMRYHLVETGAINERIYTTHIAFWIFALGWAAHQAQTWKQKAVVAAVAVAFLPPFFYEPGRGALVAGGLLLLMAVSQVAVPRFLAPILSSLAGASLVIYLTHFAIYPHLWNVMDRRLVVVICLVVGVAVWRAGQAITALTSVRQRGRPALAPVEPTTAPAPSSPRQPLGVGQTAA